MGTQNLDLTELVAYTVRMMCNTDWCVKSTENSIFTCQIQIWMIIRLLSFENIKAFFYINVYILNSN